MKYEQITQVSKIYKYGDGEEFMSREDAKAQADKALLNVKTELALQRLHERAIAKLVEAQNGFQIVIKINIPKFV